MRSIDDLFDEAKYGRLTKTEISYVVQKIKEATPGNDWDLYTLIHILGLSGETEEHREILESLGLFDAKEYRKLLESFLYYPSNPMVSGMALKSLCTYWNDAQNYLDQIKAFIKGVDWDEDREMRLAAIHCARDFLSQTPEKELLLLLFSIYNEFNDKVIALAEDPYQISDFENAKFWRSVIFDAFFLIISEIEDLALVVNKSIKALALSVGKSVDDFMSSPPGRQKHKFIDSVLEQVVKLIESLD